VAARLAEANEARERGLSGCRQAVRASAASIRAIHRLDRAGAERLAAEAESHLRGAQAAMRDHPQVEHAGFLHDAEKEYAEARITAALVAGGEVPGPEELGVGDAAWLHGCAEAASELRRHSLDRLRAGDVAAAEVLLGRMDSVFGELVTVDAPDALTGGLRRALDALRAVIERTRGDVTAAAVQQRLERRLDRLAVTGREPDGADRGAIR
jgi:translin